MTFSYIITSLIAIGMAGLPVLAKGQPKSYLSFEDTAVVQKKSLLFL